MISKMKMRQASYLHSFTICVCDDSMWQSQTYEGVGQIFFFILSPFFSLSLADSRVFNVISSQATNDNARSRQFDWSHVFDTHFSFLFFYDFLPLSLVRSFRFCFECAFALDFSSRLVLFFVHRAYQWNFRTTAAPASGDDINIHIVLFITSGFLLEKRRNLRCAHTYRYDFLFLFRLMSKNIKFELARDNHDEKAMMSFETNALIVWKKEEKREKRKRKEDTNE